MPSHTFSAYTREEQKNALELEAIRIDYLERKAALAEALKQAQARLSVRSIFDEFAQSAKFTEAVRDEFEAELEGFMGLHQESYDQAAADGYALQTEWQSHTQRLEKYKSAMYAARVFKEEYRVDPVVDPDLPPPDELSQGIYAYETLVQNDLEATRKLLTDRAPALLGSWEFRSVELYFESGGDGGSLVQEAADRLLAHRIKLANLRTRVKN